MEDNNNDISNNNDNEESKKIVSNFKNELERLKQKLSKDFYKHSQLEKEKNENNSNFHYMNFNINNTNDKIEPNKIEILNTEPKENLDSNKIGSYNFINQTEKESDKEDKATKPNTNSNTNTNVSIFTKVPSLEELKMKYGINLSNKPSCIKEITIEANMSKFNNIKDFDLIKYNKNNKDNKDDEDVFNVQKRIINDNNGISNLNKEYIEEKNIDKNSMKNSIEDINKEINESSINNLNKVNINNDNAQNNQYLFNPNKMIDDISNINNNNLNNNDISNINKNDNDKFDYINLLNLKNNTEEEIKNILNRRDILDLSSNDSDKENSNEEIKTNNINNMNNMNNILNNKEDENFHEDNNNDNNNNQINKKTIIKKDDEEDDEIEMINKYISDDKLSNNNFNNISIFKNNLNNNNNISCFSNISNINNNNQEFQKQLMIDVTGKMDKKDDNKDLREINLKKMINENNKNLIFKANENIFNLENESKSRLITNENPTMPNDINNNINNNINLNLDTSILNSKLDQQIKLINEKSEDNRIQEERNQMKLKEIENSLQLDKRLTHDNREIRKNAIKELCEMCSNCDEEDKQKTFECFSPWVKYCLEETNSYVIPESLNFFILFNSLFPHFLSSSMKDFFDNIERYVNFGISSINENCFKIVFLIFQDKKLFSQSLNEIIKLLNTRFTKMAKFLNGLLVTMIDNNIIPENYVKLLFEKLINVYIKMGTKLTEKKQIYSKLLIFIYNNIEDDYNTSIKNNIKLKSYKETDALFNKIKKNKKQYKYRLYPKNEYNNNNNEESNEAQIANNNNNKVNNFNEKNIQNRIPERRNNNNEKKEKDNLNNLIINNSGPDVNDILSVLPSEFFEYHFLTQFQTKIKLLEETNSALSKVKNIKDKEKNLIDVYKTINYSIEDSNILIHLEGIKLLENICRLVKNFVNVQKLKLLLETCFDKLKDKKSLVKNELFTLFNMIIENHCFETDKFIIYILQFCSNQKKENAQVKMGLLEYIKLLFLQQNNVLCYEVKNLKENNFYNFIKKVVAIIQKESLSSIKDLCSDLLIIFKKRVEDIDTFYDLISELPNYRKKIINEEAPPPGGVVEEGEYKKNLKRIKSSYSFSKTKYSGGFRGNNNNRETRHERNRSNYKVNNMERNNSSSKINNSFSSKNIKVKNKLNAKNNISSYGEKSKYNTRSNFRSNNNNPKSQTGGLAKFNKKRVPSSSNIKNPNNYIKKNRANKDNNKVNKNNVSKNQKNYSSENSDNNNEEIDNDYEQNNSNINDEDYYKEMNNNKNQENNKDENFNKKKENLLDNINNLDINSIDKYSKIIIKDFLIFVKKICDDNSQKNEDLSYHFNIIFMIAEKILYRFIELLEENKGQNDKYSKLKKSLEELIGYITKIIILTPCIHQIKGTKKFDDTLLETFMDKVKEFCLDKEKYYMHLLLSLYKFCEKDEQFPSELNAKPAVVYFLKYLKIGYLETNSERLLSVLKEFISETKLLNLEEKKLLLISNNPNININSDTEQYNVKEEENNININNNMKNVNNDNDNDNDSDSDEEEKEKDIYNNKIKKDILNNNESDNDNDQVKEKDINKINSDNIMLRIKQFQDRLNNIPKQENKIEVKAIDDNEDNEDNQINNMNKFNNAKIPSLKMDYSNNKNILDEKEKNYINNTNNSKIKENDIQKIEESIRIMSKRLDKTLNKMNEASNRSKGGNMTTNNSIKDLNNNSINVSKISERNNYNDASMITSESYIKNNFISPNINLNSNTDMNNMNKEIIEQIMNVVRGNSNQNTIYQNAKNHFQNLTSLEQKLDFSQNLRNYLDNPIFLNQIPIYTCTNLFDFILSILSYQILNQSNNAQIIASLQGIAEYLLPFRSLNDMLKIMMFLLKKYFPKNLNNNIEDISLIMIKVISYLLKELLKKMNRGNVVGKEIISEINDLFTITPPSTLTTAIPNARFYQTVFALLKSITDQIASNNKSELASIIQYLQGNKIVCEEYIQYLIRLQNKI